MNLDEMSFLLGMISSIIFPIINFGIKKATKMREIKKIKLVLNSVYLEELDFTDLQALKKRNDDSAQRIDYLIKNELCYYNADTQFEYIRAAEYTKSLLKVINDIVDSYSFEDSSPILLEDEKNRTDEKITRINDVIKRYNDTLNDYMAMKRDKLV